MAKFLAGNELKAAIERLIEKADEQLLIISCDIQISDILKSILSLKKNNHKTSIMILFGNSKPGIGNFPEEDFNFYKEFPNIQLRHDKRLQTNFYANDTEAILTSMDLQSFGEPNTLHSGTLTNSTPIHNLSNNSRNGEESLDKQTLSYFVRIFEQSEIIFHKKPQYESGMLGLTKKYKDSIIEVDKLRESPGR